MKATGQVIALTAVFAGFCTAGWKWEKRPSNTGAKAATEVPAKPAKASRREGGPRSKIPPEVAARLAPLRAARTTEERLRATIQLAQSLPVGDFQAWLEAGWFDGMEDMQDNIFHRLIRARWLEEDAVGLMKYDLRDRRHLYKTSIAWAKSDPAAAIGFVMGMPDGDQRTNLISYMGRDLAKSDPGLVLSHLTDLKSKLTGPSGSALTGIIEQLAQSSPEALQAATADWPAAFKKMVEGGLFCAELKKDFTGALDDLVKSPKGKEQLLWSMNRYPDFAQLAIKHQDQLPEGWLAEIVESQSFYLTQIDSMKWLETDLSTMGLDEKQAKGFRMQAIGNLDPEELSGLLSDPGLDPNERNQAIKAAIGALTTDPKKAEDFIAKLTDGKEIEMARKILATSSEGYRMRDLTPSGFITGFTDEDSVMTRDMATTAARWGSEELRAASREFAALPAEQKQRVAAKLSVDEYGELPISLLAEAASYLVSHPQPAPADVDGENKPVSWTGHVSKIATTWAEQDPIAASRWVTSLPAGEARLWAAKNLAVRWDLYEPGAARSWVGSLSGEEQNQVRAYLESGGEDD